MEGLKYIMSFIIIYLTMVQGVAHIDCPFSRNCSKNIIEIVDLKNPWYNCIRFHHALRKELNRELRHYNGGHLISRRLGDSAFLFNNTTAFPQFLTADIDLNWQTKVQERVCFMIDTYIIMYYNLNKSIL